MLAWLMSPRGSTVTATAVAVTLALFWFEPWSKPLPGLPFWSGTTGSSPDTEVSAGAALPTVVSTPTAPEVVAPAGATATVPPPAQNMSVAKAEPPASTQAAPKPAPGIVAPAAPSGPQQPPSFDVVRVEPSGATVIAGRGEPGAVVTLMDGSQALAHATIDASGQFALLPPDLGEGSHYLTLRTGPDGQPLISKQSVAVAVARAGASKPVVAMLSEDGPARVLSDGAPLGVLSGGAVLLPDAVAIQAVEAAAGGKFTVSGVAKPGSRSRVYLNGAFLADVIAGSDGRWAVQVQKGMRPGQYVVRADELATATAAVVHRAEVPFTYPTILGEGGGRELLASRTGAAPPAIGPKAVLGSAPPGALASATSTRVAVTSPGANTAVTDATQPSTRSADLPSAGQPPAASTGADAKMATAAPTGASAEPGPVAATIVSDLRTATVARGDSLWRISRRLLGRGMNYTEIYASNASQIRDPGLIYPGQVFVVPNGAVK